MTKIDTERDGDGEEQLEKSEKSKVDGVRKMEKERQQESKDLQWTYCKSSSCHSAI